MTSDRLAVLAHELRSPVAALVALAERADTASLPKDALRRFLVLAIAAGRDVERLVSDPDLFSVRPAEVDVAELVLCLARPGVVVTAESVVVACDPMRVRQAIGNLVSNGLRHGTHVTIEARSLGDSVVIDVSDDGPGLDPALDAFARGVSAAGSSGYGLWLAREIAEAHGGRLELAATSCRGATFRLSLPVASGVRG